MDEPRTLRRIRRFLVSLSAFVLVGSLIELSLTEHMESTVQQIPFVLCVLGLVSLGIAALRPSRWTLRVLRVVMALVALGSLFGVYEHFEHNLAFELEIRPNASAGDVLLESLQGANPLLAPGILALAAILAAAATYDHPVLRLRSPAQ